MKSGIVTLAVLLSFLITGCAPDSKETTRNWTLPDGLKDCKVYYVDGPGLAYIRVVRCPNSSTSSSSDTKSVTTTVISE